MNWLDMHWWLFPVGIGLDIIWVLWMNAVEKEWPLRAGMWGMATAAVGLFATIDIVHDWQHAVPYLAGLFFGSWAGVLLKRRKRSKVALPPAGDLPEWPLGKPSLDTLKVMHAACPPGPFKSRLEKEIANYA